MLNTIIRESASLHGLDSKGVTTLILYIILAIVTCVIFVIVFCTYLAIYLSIEDKDERACIHVFLLVVETVGAVLYFYGDNITHVIQHVGQEFCGQQCASYVRISAAIFLALAIVCYLFGPVLNKLYKMLGYKPKTNHVHHILDMITAFPKIDAMYTAVILVAQTDDFCTPTEKSIRMAFIIFCIIVGIGLIGFHMQ